MRLFHSQYKDRFGKTKKAKTWTIEYRDHVGLVRRIAGFRGRRETEALGRKIEELVALRLEGKQPGHDLARWLEKIPAKQREKLVKFGLLDTQRAAAMNDLEKHLDDWEQSLLAKGTTDKQAAQVKSRSKRVFDGCGYRKWSDITAFSVEQFLKNLRSRKKGISARTHNGYVGAIKQYARWMVANGRASASPVDHLPLMKTDADIRHERRALQQKEIQALLSTTAVAETRFGMSGYQRALLYKLALETGLRANELRSLTVGSFDWKQKTVTVEAAYSKRRRKDVQPLRSETTVELKAMLKTTHPDTQAFTMPNKSKLIHMLKADLGLAGIEYEVSGRYADFHALRHTFITEVVKSGATIKEAQTLARHSKPELTIGIYTHLGLNDTRKVIENLPDFSIPKKKTGTDDDSL